MLRTIQLVGRNVKPRFLAMFFAILFLLLAVNSIYAATIIYTVTVGGRLIITEYDSENNAIRYITILSTEAMSLQPGPVVVPLFTSNDKEWKVMVKKLDDGPLIVTYPNPNTESPYAELKVSRNGDSWDVMLTELGGDTLLVGDVTRSLSGHYYRQDLENGEFAITRELRTIGNIPILEETNDLLASRIAGLRESGSIKSSPRKKKEGKAKIKDKAKINDKVVGRTIVVGSNGVKFTTFTDNLATEEVTERLTISLGILSGWLWYPSQFGPSNGCDAIFVHDNVVLFSETKGDKEVARLGDWAEQFYDGYIKDHGKGLVDKISGLIDENDPRKQIVPFMKRVYLLEPTARPRLLRGLHCIVGYGRQESYRETLNEEDIKVLVEKLNGSNLPEGCSPKWEPVWKEEIGQLGEEQLKDTPEKNNLTLSEEADKNKPKIGENIEALEEQLKKLGVTSLDEEINSALNLLEKRGATRSYNVNGSLRLEIPLKFLSGRPLVKTTERHN